ncbi:hypothetical protein B0O99DRAFT_619912 [Bisporella sp. PMI_857]|nr:hypothetical protein B0O99DRAFT_619912 [Bisporella sp. PMI_857]
MHLFPLSCFPYPLKCFSRIIINLFIFLSNSLLFSLLRHGDPPIRYVLKHYPISVYFFGFYGSMLLNMAAESLEIGDKSIIILGYGSLDYV